ncbi:four helix bundle protein [Patescibacteria group bacterium]
MQNFHDHKLWQESYVVLMDLYDVAENLSEKTVSDDILDKLLSDAQNVTAKVADGLSRKDRRTSRDLIYDAVGLVAVTRTQLAVAWGRGLLNDKIFKGIDDKYQKLNESLQGHR